MEALQSAFPDSIPKVILLAPANLDNGLSQKLFIDFVQQLGNVVLLTEKSAEETLAGRLMREWEAQQGEGKKWGQGNVGEVVRLEETIQVLVSLRFSFLLSKIRSTDLMMVIDATKDLSRRKRVGRTSSRNSYRS